ncbi:MAG: hypothetical protein E4H43_02840 [Bacteroidia bacterium]|nr:MAG: hypothetical protein E4H43_02840 [Bacteroidia bacterium]
MNRIIKNPVLYILIVVLCFILLIPSCESLKKDHEFIGTWEFTGKITSDDIVYNTTRTIILMKNSYEETYVIQRENSSSVSAIIGTMGDLNYSHSSLIFELKKLGTCTLDELERCTGNVEWHGEGTGYWADNEQFFEKTVIGHYETGSATLRLIRDLNNDGDTLDTGEDVTFEMI